MRSKTFVLGILLLLSVAAHMLFSANSKQETYGVGSYLGDVLPSIKVDDIATTSPAGSSLPDVVVLWARSDAKSRMVNVWTALQHRDSHVLSICVDADTPTALQYVALDALPSEVTVVGREGASEILKHLKGVKEGYVLTLDSGFVSSATPALRVWAQMHEIDSNH